ncbi:Putative helix-turn-helix protein, YlxM / p13 like [Natranaerofaba carboxydovora]|nr:Putative helix-turn-helix protein, YlxM / p13 like [Natranaerofaba carboxydovora]
MTLVFFFVLSYCKALNLNTILVEYRMGLIMLEKTNKINLLFDFYGPLLTDKQEKAIRLYYIEDYSLGEIADNLNISRQGVFDSLKRGEEALDRYEEKLGLYKKFAEQREVLLDLRRILEKPINQISREKCLKLLDRLT